MTARRRTPRKEAEPHALGPNEPGFRGVSREDLKRTQQLAAAMLQLAEGATAADLEALGIRPEDVQAVRRHLAASERAVPKARDVALATISGMLGKEFAWAGYVRAQRALHALAPLVVLRMAEKIDNDQAPGSTRILVELAKGLGLLAPAEPVSTASREGLLSLEEERRRPVEDLKAEVLGGGAP